MKITRPVRKPLLAGAALLMPVAAWAQESPAEQNKQTLPPVEVHQDKDKTTKSTKKPPVKAQGTARSNATGGEASTTSTGNPGTALPPGASVLVSTPQPGPVTSITPEGLALLGGPGQTSFYQAADFVPSVVVESPDPYGLSPTRNISIRGKDDFHLSRDIDGLPIMGIVGGADLFDLQNVQRLDVYRGVIPADKSLGISNASGLIDQILLGPKDKPTEFIEQSFGSYGFSKTFARADTGFLPSGTAAFVSASDAETEKWKGEGNQSRQNFTTGVSQTFSPDFKVDIYTAYNHYDGDLYRALTYAQATNLGAYYHYDYNTTLTGNSATDVNYYKFNKLSYDNFTTLAKVDYQVADGQHIIFKPYYWSDDGVQESASGNSVQIWRQQNENYGGVLEYDAQFTKTTNALVGYWWQSMAPPPPPTDQRLFTVDANGNLDFQKWSTIGKIDNFIVNSPYGQLTQNIGTFTLTGGLRYMDLGAPKMEYYKTAGVANGSLDQAIASSTLDPNANVVARDYDALLPNVGITENFGNGWSASLAYGRNFGRPDWGPQASNYLQYESTFLAKGVTLQDLVNNVRPELADQYNLSVRYDANGLTIVPTLFYSHHNNKQVLVSDQNIPVTCTSGTPPCYLSYYSGVDSSTEYGAELEGSYKIRDDLTMFGSATRASETFDTNTPILTASQPLQTKGKQVPLTPEVMAKGGVTYLWNGIALTPMIRYIGARYGDAQDQQKIPGYTTVDFAAAYDLKQGLGLRWLQDAGVDSLVVKFQVLNIFNREYIGEISANDTSLSAGTSYYAGAPRTFVGSISAKF